MNAFAWVGIFALSSIALSACLDTPDQARLSADEPRIGDTYRYMGSDGSTLTARIIELAARTDGFGRTHEALIVNWSIEWPELQVMFYFEEALDLGTGLVIQQVAKCAIWYINESRGDSPLCWDDRSRVLFEATGLPGAFGAGPFWLGVREQSGVAKVETKDPTVNGTDEITYEVQPAEKPGCFRLESHTKREPVAALPQTVVTGPIILCDDHSFPTRFKGTGLPPAFASSRETAEIVQYLMSDATRGTRAMPTAQDDSAWSESGTPLATPSWDHPLFVIGHDEPLPLTLAEAHEATMQAVGEYREMVEARSDVLLVEYRLSSGGRSESPPLNETHRYELRFKVVDDAGNGFAVMVTRQITEHYAIPPLRNASTEEETRVESATAFTAEHAPAAATVSPKHARLGDALARGEELTGQRYDGQTLRISFEPSGHGWSGSQASPRSDGYEIVVRFPEPNMPTTGFVRIFPYTATFDGPTGGVLMLDRPRDMMPY